MRILLIFALVFAALTTYAAEKETAVFTLDHQMSEMCKKKITENLRFEKGVSKIDVSLKDNTITITYDPAKTDTEKLIGAFKKIGFNASLYDPYCLPENCAPKQPCCAPAEPAPCCN